MNMYLGLYIVSGLFIFLATAWDYRTRKGIPLMDWGIERWAALLSCVVLNPLVWVIFLGWLLWGILVKERSFKKEM